MVHDQGVDNEHDERPWGAYTVLDDAPGHKVKRIEVLPGGRLSYQRHARRAEHWFVVAGTAEVTLDGAVVVLRPGEAIDIARGAAHRVANPGTAGVRGGAARRLLRRGRHRASRTTTDGPGRAIRARLSP